MKHKDRKNIEAFATDIDGTLTDGKYLLSTSAIEALRKLEKRGIPVLLVSGNALPVVQTLKRYLGCTGAIICENGSVVKYRKSLETLGSSKKVKAALQKLKDKLGDGVQEHWSNRYRMVDCVIKRTLRRSKIDSVISEVEGVKLVDSGFAYHISSREVDKGEGLKIAGRLMGVSLRRIAAIGDSETDRDLLRTASFRLTLANAPASLRDIAHHITKKENGEGFAEATDVVLSRI
ncbi:MAG: phosphoglycolate phosphatase [Thermoproteota archaeon]